MNKHNVQWMFEPLRINITAFTQCFTSRSEPRAGAAPPFFMTCEWKMRVPRAGAAPPFVHHQTRRFRSGSRSRSSGNFFSIWTEAGAAPAIYVNIRWISRAFLQGSFFSSPSPTHAVFCTQRFALRAQMNVVGTLTREWARENVVLCDHKYLTMNKRNWISVLWMLPTGIGKKKLNYSRNNKNNTNHLRMAFGFAFEQSSVRYGTYVYRCRAYHGYRIGPADCTTCAFKARNFFCLSSIVNCPGCGSCPAF